MRNFCNKKFFAHIGHGFSVELDASNGSQDFYDDCLLVTTAFI